MTIQYYVLDTETTGLKQGFHELTEISIIRCADKMQVSRKVKCQHPEFASFDALQITGKTIADLHQGVHHKQMIQDVNNFFQTDNTKATHRCIIGHNIHFDRKFLHHYWMEADISFPADLWLDTLSIARDITKKMGFVKPKLGLDAACDLFKIKKLGIAHTAKSDSRNTYLLWKKFMDDNIDFLPFIKNIPHIIKEDEISFEDFDNA
jgi:DNA polymerase III alpha subunit (gram-positive type)